MSLEAIFDVVQFLLIVALFHNQLRVWTHLERFYGRVTEGKNQ